MVQFDSTCRISFQCLIVTIIVVSHSFPYALPGEACTCIANADTSRWLVRMSNNINLSSTVHLSQDLENFSTLMIGPNFCRALQKKITNFLPFLYLFVNFNQHTFITYAFKQLYPTIFKQNLIFCSIAKKYKNKVATVQLSVTSHCKIGNS